MCLHSTTTRSYLLTLSLYNPNTPCQYMSTLFYSLTPVNGQCSIDISLTQPTSSCFHFDIFTYTHHPLLPLDPAYNHATSCHITLLTYITYHPHHILKRIGLYSHSHKASRPQARPVPARFMLVSLMRCPSRRTQISHTRSMLTPRQGTHLIINHNVNITFCASHTIT